MGKRLERFGEVRIIDETNGFFMTLPDQCPVLFSQFKGHFYICLKRVDFLIHFSFSLLFSTHSMQWSTAQD